MKKDFTLAVLIATALTLTGCATPPLVPFQLSEIARQRPWLVDQCVEMAGAIKDGEDLYRRGGSTTVSGLSGTGTLVATGWVRASRRGSTRSRAVLGRQVAYAS